MRYVVGALGVAMALFGGWHLLSDGRVLEVLPWLVGAVLVHDAVLAPATIGVVVAARRVLPFRTVRPAAVAFVVIATVTITAVPVLGAWGRHSDNPTLLDRDYVAGWCAFVVVVLAGVVLWDVIDRRRAAGATAEEE